jgi:hypothetical protein
MTGEGAGSRTRKRKVERDGREYEHFVMNVGPNYELVGYSVEECRMGGDNIWNTVKNDTVHFQHVLGWTLGPMAHHKMSGLGLTQGR